MTADRRTLVSVARRRAAARQQQDVILSGNALVADDTRLEDIHRSNEEKRRQVQEKVNRAVALGWLCEGYIDLVFLYSCLFDMILIICWLSGLDVPFGNGA
jgi:hypothetical protein